MLTIKIEAPGHPKAVAPLWQDGRFIETTTALRHHDLPMLDLLDCANNDAACREAYIKWNTFELEGTFHRRCSCPLHLAAAVRGKQHKGKDARDAVFATSESTNFIVSATTELLRSMRHAPRYRESLLHALTRG